MYLISQLNMGNNYASVIGIFYLLIGLIYSIKFFKRQGSFPEKALILAVVFPMIGGILLIHGWRLDPIFQFKYFLSLIVIINFVYKDIKESFN